MKLLVAVILLTAYAPAAHPKHYVFGNTQSDVWRLFDLSGETIQLNVSTYGGALIKGSYNSKKYGGICNTNSPTCYGSDGRGNWRFLFTGVYFCVNTCTYTAKGDLTMSEVIQLPDGSTIIPFSAVLYGTFVSDSGVTQENVMAYYTSFTAPALDGNTTQAVGGLIIVFQDN